MVQGPTHGKRVFSRSRGWRGWGAATMTIKIKPSIEDVNKMLAEVLAEKGYLVIGTKAGRTPYERHQPVFELFGIPQDDDYFVDCFTDGAEYVEQMKHFAKIRPSFPWTAKG